MATTNAEIAVQLLREAADFYRTLGGSSPELKDRMDEFGVLYEEVAELLDADPNCSPTSRTPEPEGSPPGEGQGTTAGSRARRPETFAPLWR